MYMYLCFLLILVSFFNKIAEKIHFLYLPFGIKRHTYFAGFEVWNHSTFIPPSFSKHLQPLPFYLRKKTVNCKKCLLTAATVARSLGYLHERDLSHTKLSIQEIYMKPTVKVCFSGQHRQVFFGLLEDMFIQSNFNGSNTFGTIKTCSRQG